MQNQDAEDPIAGNFWNKDLKQNKHFRKTAIVLVLLPFLALLLFSASAIFGVVATGIYFVLMLIGFKLYDVYEDKKRRAYRCDWEKGMQEGGWQQVARNRWEMKYWDFYEERYVIHRYFTDEPIPKRFTSPRPKVRRHPSYIVCRKRIRRK